MQDADDLGHQQQGNADIEKIDVDGKVFLSSGTQQATADKGSFNMAQQLFVLEGERVVLSEGEYRAIAKNEGKVFERSFNVVNGVDGEVEVVAR